jgi:hydrogenase maturation protease
MDLELVDRIVNAVLYEGYMLYPYRPTAVKNRQRWNFGVLYPEPFCETQGGTDASVMQTECLAVGSPRATLDVRVRFLHLLAREVGEMTAPATGQGQAAGPAYRPVEVLEVEGRVFQPWQEAVERDVSAPALELGEIAARPRVLKFSFPASRELGPIRESSGRVAGAIIRKQQSIEGAVEVAAGQVGERLWKITARVLNLTPAKEAEPNSREEALMRSLVSTHTILRLQDGQFVSLLDPPEAQREAASLCHNIGAWPVLVGREGARDSMLSSPIILYDYPQVAPESAGDFFDGTEIDEMLALRILTLTDEEKREMRNSDARARALLERTETLPPEQMMKLHGTVRGLRQLKEGER